MKVVYGVSQKGNVICIIQIHEMVSEKSTVETTRSMIQSIAQQNRAGARTQPCRTPDVVMKLGDCIAAILTLEVEPLCRSSIRWSKYCEYQFLSGPSRGPICPESKAAFRSTKAT